MAKVDQRDRRQPVRSRRRRLPLNPQHPRYWPIFCLSGVARLLARLPGSLRVPFGRMVGRLWQRLSRRRREITAHNLAICFPRLSPEEAGQLQTATFVSAGLGVTETLMAWFGKADPRSMAIEGLDLLRDAHRQGGVVLIGAHFSTMELAGAMLASHVPLDVIYRGNPNAAIDVILWRARRQHYQAVMERGEIRRLIRRLRDGAIVWYAADQDYGAGHSDFTPFFGEPAATINVVPRLVATTAARTLAVSHFRAADARSWKMVVREIEADPAAINRWLEEEIGRAPDQYLWQHRRFKTRPPGAPSIYRDGGPHANR